MNKMNDETFFMLDLGNKLAITAYDRANKDPDIAIIALTHAIGNIYGALRQVKTKDMRKFNADVVERLVTRLDLEDQDNVPT